MAKSLIQISVKAQKNDCFCWLQGRCLAVGVFSDATTGSLVKALDKKLGGAIAKVRKLGDFEAKPGSSCLLYSDGKTGPNVFCWSDWAKRKDVKPEVLRKAAALATTKAVELKAKSVRCAVFAYGD